MEMANTSYQDKDGNIKVKVDPDKCISCGRCIFACKHDARFFTDDMDRFFSDLRKGVPISLIAAPSIKTNVPGYKKLFTYFKNLGVKQIYDASLGADICIWAHLKHIEQNGAAPMITQPCPVIVTYCEMYRNDLLKRLSPVHSPMACASIFLKEYQGVHDRIAVLSPCVAKANEFEEIGLAEYSITFNKLLDYLTENHIFLPEEETGFDHGECGPGTLFPMPGGLKENIEYFMGKNLHIIKAEGFGVFERLNEYAATPEAFLPDLFDVLNCTEGCNIGPASSPERGVFEIGKMMDENRRKATDERKREHYRSVYRAYDGLFDVSRFLREYRPIPVPFPQISDEDIVYAFSRLSKTDETKQHVDCGACGSNTCYGMARKIALEVNIPANCIVKSKEDAKIEHENNMHAYEQLADMEKTREADERLRIVVDATSRIAILFDGSFKVEYCNPAAYEFFGFKSKEDLFSRFVEFVIKHTPQFQSDGQPSISIAERLETAVKEDYTRFEAELLQDGAIRFYDVEMKKIPYGNSYGIVVFISDITGIYEREKELRHAHEQNELQLAKLNLAVQATKIVLWDMEIAEGDTDPVNDARYFRWSDDFRRLLGFSGENDFPNLVGSFNNRLHPEDKERNISAFEKHLLDKTGKTPYDIEIRVMKKSGEYAYYHITGKTIRDEEGHPLRVAGALMDVTETKNLIQEIDKRRMEADAANKAKSEFLSAMSHEIRTPMNAIMGITEVQLQNESLDPGIRVALDKIYASSDLLLGIINDILDLSKIEAGKLELLNARYAIASLISDSAQLNMIRIGSKPIEFKLSVDERMPAYMLGDELRVKQILNNLLSNAFKYTAEGTVNLAVTAEDSGTNADEAILVLNVADTGQGMTKEQIDTLFEEYVRFNMEANRTTEGTGLGMSITQNLIHLMDGEIFIESEPGIGSTFIVRLPQGRSGLEAVGKEVALQLQQFQTSSRAQMRRVQITREPMPYGSVLIVDDVDTNIYVAKGLLSPYELEIDSADSGFAAIDKIKKGKVYDIIFMDHMMPKMDGIEAAKIIRDIGYDRPIVALTANAVTGQAEIFQENGFDGFISKPIDIRHLNAVLNKWIRDKQPPEVIQAAKKQQLMKEGQKRAAGNAQQPDGSDEGRGAAAAGFAIDPRFSEVFVRDAMKVIAALEELSEINNYRDADRLRAYITNVHGIKSALANIGKMDLSNVAFQLEIAGRDKKWDTIASSTPDFLRSLRAFTESLAPRKDGEEAAAGGIADGARSTLTAKLLTIKAACAALDEATIDKALAELRGAGWPQPVKALLGAIDEQLLHSDFDEIAEGIDMFIKAL